MANDDKALQNMAIVHGVMDVAEYAVVNWDLRRFIEFSQACRVVMSALEGI